MFNLLNSLPNDKFLDVIKLKAFADDELNVAKTTIFLFDRAENTVGKEENAGYQHFLLFPQCFRAENTVGKEENAGYQHFLLFPQCFPKLSSLGSLKVGIVW